MRYPNGCHAAGANNFKIILTANGCSVVPQPRLCVIGGGQRRSCGVEAGGCRHSTEGYRVMQPMAACNGLRDQTSRPARMSCLPSRRDAQRNAGEGIRASSGAACGVAAGDDECGLVEDTLDSLVPGGGTLQVADFPDCVTTGASPAAAASHARMVWRGGRSARRRGPCAARP
jgi:hypothetical protein